MKARSYLRPKVLCTTPTPAPPCHGIRTASDQLERAQRRRYRSDQSRRNLPRYRSIRNPRGRLGLEPRGCSGRHYMLAPTLALWGDGRRTIC
ncbi:hypothetical protein BDW74DRAFT_162398 [Aspergillus multicolor]|uniref:uncharacterized protein n=1 Tax=Aspergillus multicolor TaxID=41759 RepID=UPI003CCDB778